MTLQQIVLSKNQMCRARLRCLVLTLQQIVLSKNGEAANQAAEEVLTLQQIVLSKNAQSLRVNRVFGFDFTTNCSF